MQGYPTIKSFANGRWQDYQGERSAGAIKDHALRLLPDKVPPSGTFISHKQLMSAAWLGQGKPCGCKICPAWRVIDSQQRAKCHEGMCGVTGTMSDGGCMQVTTLGKAGDLQAFVGKCTGKASSGACAVLVTDKSSTPPVFKALAAELGAKLGFAAAKKGALDLVSELGLTRCSPLRAQSLGMHGGHLVLRCYSTCRIQGPPRWEIRNSPK